MQQQRPTLIRSGQYADTYRISVDGVAYTYNVREGGSISGVRVDRPNARGGLKSGSKQHQKVVAAINLANGGAA